MAPSRSKLDHNMSLLVPVTNAVFRVELPALKDVRGAVHVTSTTDISDFCKQFDSFESSGVIQGVEKCTSNNSGMTNVNYAAIGLVAVAGLFELL